jgi:hypothetical protein
MKVSNEEIISIKRKLQEHEKRLEHLENLTKGKTRAVASGRRSIIDHLTRLKLEGFFDRPNTTKEILEKLAQEGYHYPHASLTEPLQRAIRQGILGRTKKNKVWAYSKR